MDKHSRLLRKSVNLGQKSFITLAPDEMTVDDMTIDKMTVDEMTADEMTEDSTKDSLKITSTYNFAAYVKLGRFIGKLLN